jgi:hypothetical protein
MKMGNIVSPWRYDAMFKIALRPPKARSTRRRPCDRCRGWPPISIELGRIYRIDKARSFFRHPLGTSVE